MGDEVILGAEEQLIVFLELSQNVLDGSCALVVLHQPGDDQRLVFCAIRFRKIRGGESDEAVDRTEIGGSAGPEVVPDAVRLRL